MTTAKPGNPFNPDTDPQRHETWEKTVGANQNKTAADRRSELHSAQLEDAGLHPQGLPAGSTDAVGVADGIGDTTNQRATATGRGKKTGPTPAEAFRAAQAGAEPTP